MTSYSLRSRSRHHPSKDAETKSANVISKPKPPRKAKQSKSISKKVTKNSPNMVSKKMKHRPELLVQIVQRGIVNELKKLGSHPIKELTKSKLLSPSAIRHKLLAELKNLTNPVTPSAAAVKSGRATAVLKKLALGIKKRAVVAEIRRKANKSSSSHSRLTPPRSEHHLSPLKMHFSPVHNAKSTPNRASISAAYGPLKSASLRRRSPSLPVPLNHHHSRMEPLDFARPTSPPRSAH